MLHKLVKRTCQSVSSMDSNRITMGYSRPQKRWGVFGSAEPKRSAKNMKNDNILKLAASYGLRLREGLRFNEMGIDFKVVFAQDLNGSQWVLRIPRRTNLDSQIELEKKILNLVRKHLSVSVPDWKLASPNLIAYPLLENKPVITFDPKNHEITWNMDQKENKYVSSLSQVLFELHQIPSSEAASIGLKWLSPEMARQEISDSIGNVKREIGICSELETRWKKWVDSDNLWPDFSVFVHGDLYAGHILSDEKGNISGIIDWSEAQVSDPSIDFAGHLTVFGEQSLRELIFGYERSGGRVWDKIFEHTLERHAAAPLKYAVFALQANIDEHIEAAKIQIGVA